MDTQHNQKHKGYITMDTQELKSYEDGTVKEYTDTCICPHCNAKHIDTTCFRLLQIINGQIKTSHLIYICTHCTNINKV